MIRMRPHGADAVARRLHRPHLPRSPLMTESSAFAMTPEADPAAVQFLGADEVFLRGMLAHAEDACGTALITLLRLCGARAAILMTKDCLLYTSDAADERSSV